MSSQFCDYENVLMFIDQSQGRVVFTRVRVGVRVGVDMGTWDGLADMALGGPVRLCDALSGALWYVGMGRPILGAYTGLQRV